MKYIYIFSVCVFLSPAAVDRDNQDQLLKTRGKGKEISKEVGKKRSPHSEARSSATRQNKNDRYKR